MEPCGERKDGMELPRSLSRPPTPKSAFWRLGDPTWKGCEEEDEEEEGGAGAALEWILLGGSSLPEEDSSCPG